MSSLNSDPAEFFTAICDTVSGSRMLPDERWEPYTRQGGARVL